MEPSFDALFESLQRRVFSLCLRLTSNRAEAEDACQEVWLAVHAGLPRFRGDAQPSTWVYRIALRTGLRARARWRTHAELLPDSLTIADPRPRADEQLATSQRDRMVAEALARLSAAHKTVLSLFSIEELSHKEIAAILGVAEGIVWSRLHAARKRLAQEIASVESGGARVQASTDMRA